MVLSTVVSGLTVFAAEEIVAGGYKIDMSDIPKVHFADHPEWVELYDAAWNFHKGNIRQVQQGLNPELTNSSKTSYYVDEAFDNSIFQWDTLFMMLFDKYGYHQFPTLNSMDNFYYHQIDEPGNTARDGYICRRISESNGGWYYSNPATIDAINPPLYGWAEWEQYLVHGDVTRFTRVVKNRPVIDRLDSYFQFIKNTRRNTQGLYVSNGQGNGLDNTPNQASNPWTESTNDMSLQQVQAAHYIAQIAREIVAKNPALTQEEQTKYTELAAKYDQEAQELTNLIQEKLWSEQGSFFFNARVSDGSHTNIVTPTGLWALAANVATPQQAKAMIETYALNSEKLYRPNGLSTVTYDFVGGWKGGFLPSGGYWNGAMWSPTSYQWIKGLGQYGYRELAFQEAVRHINALSDVYQAGAYDRYGSFLHTLWENYSSEYTWPGSTEGANTEPSRTNFVGWTGALAIGSMVEDVLGVTLNAPENAVNWNLNLTEEHGISNLYMSHNGEANRISLMAAERISASSTVDITVTATRPFTLNVTHNGVTESMEIAAGTHSYRFDGVDREAPYLQAAARVFSAQDNSLSKASLDVSAVDYVTFTANDNAAIKDGLKKQLTKQDATEKLFNVNTVGFSSHEISVNQNPPTLRDSAQLQAMGFAGAKEYVKSYHSYGEEGFMVMAPAGQQLKTLKMIVGVQNGTARFTARLSDGSYAMATQQLSAGSTEQVHVLEVPFRAASDNKSLLAEYVIAKGLENQDCKVSFKGAILEDGGNVIPPALQNTRLTSGNHSLLVDADIPQGVSYDGFRIRMGASPDQLDTLLTVDSLPYTVEDLTNYHRYYLSISGLVNGVESAAGEVVSEVPELFSRSDRERAYVDLTNALENILNGNSGFDNVRSPLNFQITGSIYRSSFTFASASDGQPKGLMNDGGILPPIQPNADLKTTLLITATCGDASISVEKEVIIPAVSKNSFPYASGTITDAPATLNLTEEGSKDWIQIRGYSGGMEQSNFAAKNTTRSITNLRYLTIPTNQTATDVPLRFTATDGDRAPSDRYGIVAKGVGNGFQFNLPYSEKMQKVKVYIAVWSATLKLELKINGLTIYQDGFENLSATTLKCFDIDYKAVNPDDVVTVVATMTGSHNAQWGGSIMFPAITLQETDGEIPDPQPESPMAPLVMDLTGQPASVNLTQEGSKDWMLFDVTNLNQIERKKGGSAISNIAPLQSVTKMNPNSATANFTYTNGTKVESGSHNRGIVFEKANNGLSFQLPYSATRQQVKLYVGAWSAKVALEATILRDGEAVGSETLYFDTGTQAGGTPAIYRTMSLSYLMEQPGDVLKVRLFNEVCHDATWGNMSIAAITLSQRYNVSVSPEITGGQVEAGRLTALPGEGVDVFLLPDEGMQLKPGTLQYTDDNGSHAIEEMRFAMPESDVVISSEFEPIPPQFSIFSATPDKMQLTIDEPVQITVVASEEIIKFSFRNESDRVVGATRLSRVSNGDGTVTTVYRLSLGTAGANRSIVVRGDVDKSSVFPYASSPITLQVSRRAAVEQAILTATGEGAPNTALVNELLALTVITGPDTAKVELLGESGGKIGLSLLSKTLNDDGNLVWQFETKVGSAGDRVLTVQSVASNGEVQDSKNVTITVLRFYPTARLLTAELNVDSVEVNQPVRLTVTTGNLAAKVGLFNEKGMGIGKQHISRSTDSKTGITTWVFEFSVGTPGEQRSFTVKTAADAHGEYDDLSALSLTLDVLSKVAR